ncbi:hypothetical protein GPJ56_008262 [Histomonas meleagridis]|uniref:uncharacterized protein n=1 Tax=Histomonas meleagridis TaxID=135588 RepID=UPI0035596F5E|nr:hypothetical protein GPJ56_008262 [Histomonas meleagridis]KAH0797283.1 hypothetical protein GO595_009965 [Histomonas meleagridis]
MKCKPLKIKNKYNLLNKIGSGSFGEIFVCQDKSGRLYAAKIEDNRTKCPQLKYEAKLYNVFAGSVNTGKIYWFGSQATDDIMVMDLFGKSIESLFNTRQKLSLKTVLMLADQMISSVEYLHKKSFIHRDIKPENFVMGLGSKGNQLYIIDFGLSKKYRDSKLKHIPLIEGKNLTGTARYASVNALKGFEQSRRDDMESLGYVLVYLLKGSLPWIGLSGSRNKSKFQMICDYKEIIPLSRVCEGLPPEFAEYLRLVRQLEFTDEPEYSRYRKMFRDLFISNGYQYDYKYDWTISNTFQKETIISSAQAPLRSSPKTFFAQTRVNTISRNCCSTQSNRNSMKVQYQTSDMDSSSGGNELMNFFKKEDEMSCSSETHSLDDQIREEKEVKLTFPRSNPAIPRPPVLPRSIPKSVKA